MTIDSTNSIRKDYWPSYSQVEQLNNRINDVQNDVDLLNINVVSNDTSIRQSITDLQNNYNTSIITGDLTAVSANIAELGAGSAAITNLNANNVYLENLTVNKPVFDITLNTAHLENVSSLNGNFYNSNLINPAFQDIDNFVANNISAENIITNAANVNTLILDVSATPVQSSAVLGYDAAGKVIPVKATFEVGFPENANYLYTDEHGTAFKGVAATAVTESDNLITAHGVLNAVNGIDANVANLSNDVNNSFNTVNDSIDGLKSTSDSTAKYYKDAMFSMMNSAAYNIGPVTNSNPWNQCTSVVFDYSTTGTTVNNIIYNYNSTTGQLSIGRVYNASYPFVRYNLSQPLGGMFSNCALLNYNIQLPPFITNIDSAFVRCANLNQNILIPNSVTNMQFTFAQCTSLNQNILIPNSVTSMGYAFTNCLSLNQNILIPNSVTNMQSTFFLCTNLNQNILIPNYVTNMSDTFRNCTNLNQNILIPNSVTYMESTFNKCTSLNQNIYLYTDTVSNVINAFYGCSLLSDKYIHIRSSIPKSTSNAIYNALVNNFTGVNWTGRVINDLAEPTVWPPVD